MISVLELLWVLTGMFPWHPGLLEKVCKGKKHTLKQLTLRRKEGICVPSFLPFLFLFGQGYIQRVLTKLHF